MTTRVATGKYEIELSVADQRKELQALATSLNKALIGITRKRSWRESEKAMSMYKLKCQLTAVQMAIDGLTAKMEIAAGAAALVATNKVRLSTTAEVMAGKSSTQPR